MREPNVGKFLSSMTARQFRAWELYDAVEPIGDIRSDYQSAQIAQMLYNVNRGKKDKALKLEEFLLKFGLQEEQPKKQTPEQQFRILKLLAAMHANEGDAPPKVLHFSDGAAVNAASAIGKLREIAGDNPNITFA